MDSANDTKNRLEQVIDDQGRQKQWVATQLGISRVTLHRWCTGAAVPEPKQHEIVGLLFPELPEADREGKRIELFPEEATVGG